MKENFVIVLKRINEIMIFFALLMILSNSIMIIPDEIAGQPVQTLEFVIAEIPMGRLPFALAVNPSTNLIYVALSDTTTVSVMDGKTNNVTKTIPVGEFQWDIALNPSTNLIYVSDAAQTGVWVIDGNNI